jgi:hypothetical protein
MKNKVVFVMIVCFSLLILSQISQLYLREGFECSDEVADLKKVYGPRIDDLDRKLTDLIEKQKKGEEELNEAMPPMPEEPTDLNDAEF